jgi:hypothetical protein
MAAKVRSILTKPMSREVSVRIVSIEYAELLRLRQAVRQAELQVARSKPASRSTTQRAL